MAHRFHLSDADRRLFEQAMQDVAPRPAGRAIPYRPPLSSRPRQTELPRREVIDLLQVDFASDPAPQTGDEMVYACAGLRPDTLRRLRRRRFSLEDELDLHGRTVAQACIDLGEFIADSRAAGRRCVRVVHGKGLRSPGRRSVLKPWLDRLLRHCNDVLAYCSARPDDGGTGALYVLLKR